MVAVTSFGDPPSTDGERITIKMLEADIALDTGSNRVVDALVYAGRHFPERDARPA